MLSFFPRNVLDEILDLIDSVSEGRPTYSSYTGISNARYTTNRIRIRFSPGDRQLFVFLGLKLVFAFIFRSEKKHINIQKRKIIRSSQVYLLWSYRNKVLLMKCRNG